MKTNIYTKALAALCAASAILAGCRKEVPVQEEPVVKLSYESLTGLVPNGRVTASPEITSGEPTDFSISSVFFGEFAYKGGMFSIDSETGEIAVTPAADAAEGEYLVSVNCVSPEGKKYIFKNALSATVISGMPQLSVTPSTLNLKFEDLQPSSDAILLNAQVTATGDAAKVTGYELRNLRKDGEPVESIGDFFSIDESGMVSAVKGDAWAIGKYVMDIKVNTESFGTESTEGLIANALTVNVSAEPVVVNYTETPAFAPNIPKTYTPTVTGPVPSGYAISKVTLGGEEYSGAEFSIDPATGVVTASGKEDTAAGEYKVSITYKYAGQDLSSDDVLTVKCLPGVPEGLLVTPPAASVEDKDIAEGSSTELPVFTLTANGESAAVTGYEIRAVRKDGADFAFSGLVTVEHNTVHIQNGNWPLGTYTFDVKVNTESFGTDSDKGFFTDVFTLTVFQKIELAYDSATKKEHTLWSISPLTPMPAGYTYSFTNPAASYTSFISLDPSTGVLSALKGNNLSKEIHRVSVTASAPGQESSIAECDIEVVENPYYFTYFSYGNNLGLTEEQTDGVSQFRIPNKNTMAATSPEIQYTDLPDSGKDNVTYTIEIKSNLSGATIDSGTGKLSFTTKSFTNYQSGVLFVTATSVDPDDAANTFTVKMPVFFIFPAMNPTSLGRGVNYSPFVLRVNPHNGQRVSEKPTVTGVADMSLFCMDFRRDFRYWDLDGNTSLDTTDAIKDISEGHFLYSIWGQYAWGSASISYSSNNPLSYFKPSFSGVKSADELAETFAYIDNANDYKVVVNPDKWINQGTGHAANGVFLCQAATTDTGDPTKLDKGYNAATNPNTAVSRPFIIWFDPTFEK